MNIDISNTRMSGDVDILLYDMDGKLLISKTQLATPVLQLAVDSLTDGNYFVQIRNNKYLVGKRVVIVRK
ncbi:MAG: T9SS type A sorting domain-containing protein [Saprospiraceae bacterium]|nr:T9SS type A sorting domain-containing protein [Saprospiraceae bacterium]